MGKLGRLRGTHLVGLFDAIGNAFSGGGPLSEVLSVRTPFLSFTLNGLALACVVTWCDAHSTDPLTNLGLAVNVAFTLPGLVTPVKLTGAPGAAFVSIVDALMAWTSAILSFVVAGPSQAAGG